MLNDDWLDGGILEKGHHGCKGLEAGLGCWSNTEKSQAAGSWLRCRVSTREELPGSRWCREWVREPVQLLHWPGAPGALLLLQGRVFLVAAPVLAGLDSCRTDWGEKGKKRQREEKERREDGWGWGDSRLLAIVVCRCKKVSYKVLLEYNSQVEWSGQRL